MSKVTITSADEILEPKYIVIVKTAVAITVSLASSLSNMPFDPNEMEVIELPIEQDDKQSVMDLLDFMKQKITYVSISDTIHVTASVERRIIRNDQRSGDGSSQP